MSQHFSQGRAVSVDFNSKMTGMDSPAWGFQVHGEDEKTIRSALKVAASALEQPLYWAANDRSTFELGRWTGSVVSPCEWSFYWLDRNEVEALLAVMSGGISLLPSLDGTTFEYVDRSGAASRLRAFLECVKEFVESTSASEHPPTTPPETAGWQIVFDELDREGAEKLRDALSMAALSVATVDPRERYLFLGDHETAVLVATMFSEDSASIADWEVGGSVLIAPEGARTRLEGFVADDLALFLEVGYPSALELADPRTEIPVEV